jgi:DNA-binding response OmpR family regulator
VYNVGARTALAAEHIVRILIIEDETKVANALRAGLEAERYEVTIAATGEEGFFLASQGSFDLLLLDLMLPRRGGIDVLATLRKRGIQTPVFILTAKDAVEDRVVGLDQGADDYLTKPFAFSELLARIRALLRRGRMDQILKLQQEDLEMDLVTRKVSRGAQSLDLTAKEFDILEYLLRHRGSVVSREMLAHDVWHATARATNVIDVTIARLRRKIDEPHERKLLHTVRGVGYMLGGGQG